MKHGVSLSQPLSTQKSSPIHKPVPGASLVLGMAGVCLGICLIMLGFYGVRVNKPLTFSLGAGLLLTGGLSAALLNNRS